MNRPRKGLVAAFTRSLRAGELGWSWQAAQRGLRLRLGLPVAAPLYATLAVTYRCNYRCPMCDLPERAGREPSTEVLLERLRALRRLGALAVGITGGEPLLHPGLFELLAEGQRLGLLMHVNSNGSRLAEQHVEDLVEAPLHSLNISLDGATPATHDALRQVPGSFRQIERSVRALCQKRRRGRPRLGLVMAVSRANLGEVEAFQEVAQRLGVEAAGYLPQHAFVESHEALTEEEERGLTAAFQAVQAPADNSPAYLAGIAPFLAGRPTPQACSASQTHLAVDPEGRGYPCVPLMTLSRSGVPLEEALQRRPSPSPQDREEVCRRCWWNCHRELDLTLKRIPECELVSSR